MNFKQISHNGEIKGIEQAVLHIESVEGMYGFGVYETVKVRKNIVYFLPQHIERLLKSARLIDLGHRFSQKQLEDFTTQFIEHLGRVDSNLKLALYGSKSEDTAQLYIIPSAPLFPNRTWYRDGVSLMTYTYERFMPQAKTLNMLASYYIYKKAQQQNNYDALLLDTKGTIREGTRTNVYVMKGKKIYSPPKEDVLEGVTMMSIEKVLAQTEYSIEYREIPFESLSEYDSMFISSTSTKILPVTTIDGKKQYEISPELRALIATYEGALDNCEGKFEKL